MAKCSRLKMEAADGRELPSAWINKGIAIVQEEIITLNFYPQTDGHHPQMAQSKMGQNRMMAITP